MNNKFKFILISVLIILIVTLVILFVKPNNKVLNNSESQINSVKDYEIGADRTDIEYVTKSEGLTLKDDLGVSRAIYNRIKSRLSEENIFELVTINESTYNMESNIFRFKGISIDCSDLKGKYLYTIIDNIGLSNDLYDKVDNWLRDIDAVGDVILKEYNYDTGEMKININEEDKIITIK